MYLAHWGLTDKPFENTPDPRFFFRSAQHEEALARMLYVIREQKGAGVLTGVFGCGKTVIGYALMQELTQERYKTAYLANPLLDNVNLLRMIAHQLGVTTPPKEKADTLMAMEEVLLNNQRAGKTTIVVVDEAHAITDPLVFEELRLLLNFQLPDRYLLTLLLFGQPELLQRIDMNKPFEQRLGMKCTLAPLSQADTARYIVHRLAVAGRSESLFAEGAIRRIYEYSAGIPRQINRLCDLCLLAGFVLQATEIDDNLVLKEMKSA
ncbi:MAG: AAA family ATPase [Candidatus Omnitrophica bacterium]|nr:AAA family ATPase [Candidatus Omnitrophota bacterium]